MDTTSLKIWVTRFLLAFVLVSIGFAVGKEAGLRASKRNAFIPSPAALTAPQKVVVLYFHATFRCVTCNTIERLAKQVVDERFTGARDAEKLEWLTANYQEQEALAEAFNIASACVVVATVRGGETISFDRLEQVWDLVEKPIEFSEYIAKAIRNHLKDPS